VLPNSAQPIDAIVLHRLSCAASKICIPVVRFTGRTVRGSVELAIFLACCFISVGCGGGSTASNSGQNNVSVTYSISGTISPAQNGSGATLTLSGTANATTTADASGNYGFTGLANGTYEITPSKPGFSFNPSVQTAEVQGSSVSGLNFTVAAVVASQTFSISGNISPAQNGSGATLTLSGTANATTTADASGNYSFAGLSSGSYTITPSKSGFDFSPSSQSTTLSVANATGMNFVGHSQSASVDIYPGQDMSSIVNASPAGTTFVIHPGTYRLTQSITPKNDDNFLGQTTCDPIATPGSCTAIISGSREIGSLAAFNGTNYQVTGQTQQGAQLYTDKCYAGFAGCFYPEDLFFDGVQLTHLYATSLPTILTGQWWFDYTNHIIYFHDNPSGHLVETSVAPAAFRATGANNVTFQYLTIEEFATPVQTGMIDARINGTPTTNTGWVVRNSEIRRAHAIGVRTNFGTQVYNSYLHHNGQIGPGGGWGGAPDGSPLQSGIIIQGNVINNNNTSMISDQFGAGGVKLGGVRGPVIRNNKIQNNHGNAIHLDDAVSDATVDGNTMTGNSSGGLYIEIGTGTASVIRNNIIQLNPQEPILGTIGYQRASFDGQNNDSYCNLLEADGAATGQTAMAIVGSNRTWTVNNVPTQMASVGNTFHHNTVILDKAGSQHQMMWRNNDATNQPNFWTANPIPDYNTYHLPSLTNLSFEYDGNNSGAHAALTWAQFQAKGVEPHGTADTNYTSGYPTVAITSPADQSIVTLPATITATASDTSGISKLEFYVDWTLAATATSAPYNFTFTSATVGRHIISAMAYSNAGISACYAITLNHP
jgi:parallel beta-helix repeat protein